MRIRGILLVLVALLLTAASTNLRAEDFCTGNMMLASYAASGAVPAPAVPAPASPAATSCGIGGCGIAGCGGCGCGDGGCGCGDGDPSKCCDCCGPGTNPWDGTVKVGFGLRTSYNYISEQNPGNPVAGPPTGTSNDYNFFNPDDARIYLSGTAFGGLVKGTLNTEITGDGLAGSGSFIAPNNVTNVALLDGICQFEFNDCVNFWMGRFLPPTDRANLDGPFYQTPYDYPFVSNYPSLLAGRDDGAAYWGQAGCGRLKWQMGLFNGVRYYAGGDPINPNADGNLFIIGRFTLNLLDPEPGYYTQSCYFGDKEILAIGVTGAFQRDAAGNGTTQGDFCAASIDLLWEHRLAHCGVIDVEAAFYKYNYDVSAAEAAAGPGAGNVGAYDAAIANQGTSEYVQISYMLPHDLCIGRMSGRLQPFTRYQYYGRDFRVEAATLSSVPAPLFYEGVDFGVNYIISGYNARTTVAWEQRNAEGASRTTCCEWACNCNTSSFPPRGD